MMDAVRFIEERERMCDSFNGRCTGCEINKRLHGKICDAYIRQHPVEAVAIVEKWSKEHPKKTRQSEFLKLFPNANIDSGTLKCCPLDIDTGFRCPVDEESTCDDCKRKYWLAEMEDEDDGN